MTITITSKGQITIPTALRKRLGWKAGQKLEVDEKVPYLKATPAFDKKKMFSVIGCAKGQFTKGTRNWLEEIRGPG